MKILIVNSAYYPIQIGGSERSTQILAESLLGEGLSPIVVTVAKEDKIEYVNGVKVYYIKTPNVYHFLEPKVQSLLKKIVWKIKDLYSFESKKKIIQIIEKEQPDILHTNIIIDLTVSIWKAAYQKKIPIIHTLRDYYLLCHKSNMFDGDPCETICKKCKLYSCLKKHNTKYVTALIGVSKYILEKHIENNYFSASKFQKVIYNSVNDAKNSRQQDGKFHIGYVGRVTKYKGIEVLLDYFIHSYKNDKNVVLDIFGKPESLEYEGFLKKKYHSDNIIFHGLIPQENIYNCIDVLVIPSLWPEPFGRIVPEAYSYGVPVIVNDYGGLSELVVNGVTGYRVNIESSDFEDKLSHFIETRPDMREACFKEYQKYTKTKIVKEYIDLYEKCRGYAINKRKIGKVHNY